MKEKFAKLKSKKRYCATFYWSCIKHFSYEEINAFLNILSKMGSSQTSFYFNW